MANRVGEPREMDGAPGDRQALGALAAGSFICSLATVLFAQPTLSWMYIWLLSGLAAIGLAALLMVRSGRSWGRWLGLGLLVLAFVLVLVTALGLPWYRESQA